MPEISVVIITRNEEKNIGRCLDSVIGIADDVVVVDSFSTDKTEAICKAKRARFVQHKFEGHIEQKNWAATQARFPHILSVDADEAISEELKRSILEVKSNWVREGYYMNRLTNYCGKWIHHCGWYPDRKLRLFDSRKGMWKGVNPHDKYEMNEGDKVTGFLKGDILHYSYYTLDDHFRQINYFTDIASKEMFKEGERSRALVILFAPIIKFIRDYFFKMGFLDGAAGFTISKVSAFATYLKYKKLQDLWKASR